MPVKPVINSRLATRLANVVVALMLACPSLAQQKKDDRDKFRYRPVNRKYWNEVDSLIKTKKANLIFALPLSREASGSEKDEWRLGTSRALVELGLPIHAQYLLTQLAIRSVGTRQGFEALRMIHEIVKENSADESYLEDLAFDLDTKVDEPESRSMIGYFRARALMRKGYPDWMPLALQDIAANSTWNEELAYDKSMQMLSAGDSASSYTRFEALTRNPQTRTPTAKLAKLALARLIFERRDFKAASMTYITIDLPTRERARTLNELAWTYYYDRAYGKALGAVKALKSPYYRVLLSPETYILEMLIYRELCHFRRVKDIASEFVAHYRSVFSTIEARQPLESIPQFLQMALQEGVMQRRAVAIQQVRQERRLLAKQRWRDEESRNFLLKLGQKRENTVDAEITRMLRTRVDSLANWYLDLREQVWFLDYESSMRMIQLNDDQAEQYQPPEASKTRPDTLFWPINDEAWRDELLDYEVLVTDACKASPLRGLRPSPGGRGGER